MTFSVPDSMMRRLFHVPPILILLALPQAALAQVEVADSGDTAWIIGCALFVLLAALPGLMLRHAGHANVRNALSVLAQVAAAAAGVVLAWGIAGYSLAFARGAWIGDGSNLLLANLGELREGLTVPESAFALFQMTLALFAVGLVVGSVAERARFGWSVAFAPLWLLLVYAPVVHSLWGGGWLAGLGVMDFAGALAIQLTAGFSALSLALIAGRRRDTGYPAHAPLLSIAGGALVWVGWSGIAGGWALGATDDAASGILNLQFAACAGALGWGLLDRILSGKTSATGILSGALAGLAAISASAALVGTGGAMLIGVIAAVVSRVGAGILAGAIDDPAGVFAVHGLGGLAGTLLLPVFTLSIMGGVGFDAGVSVGKIALAQLVGVALVGLWALVGTAIAALLVSVVIPLRPDARNEEEGLDAASHGEQSWDFR
jgi:Amt family ammonium transporter